MIKGMTKYHLLVLFREPMNLIFGFTLPFFFLFIGVTSEYGAELVNMIFIPIYMMIAVMVLSFTDSALSHTHSRQVRFLQRLRMTPVKPASYVLTGILSRFVILLIFAIIFIGVASVIYDLDLAYRNLPLFTAVLILVFVMFYSIGMFTANILKGAKNSQNLVWIVFFGLLIVGGNAALQLENMPETLQTIAKILPPVQAAIALQTAWGGYDTLQNFFFFEMVLVALIMGGVFILLRNRKHQQAKMKILGILLVIVGIIATLILGANQMLFLHAH
ncbi:MAG: ABC transporter permease [Defluviitaleaceae bacterium]|nr:ABC transporter permease [Defluviitaleaceae bacterium]